MKIQLSLVQLRHSMTICSPVCGLFGNIDKAPGNHTKRQNVAACLAMHGLLAQTPANPNMHDPELANSNVWFLQHSLNIAIQTLQSIYRRKAHTKWIQDTNVRAHMFSNTLVSCWKAFSLFGSHSPWLVSWGLLALVRCFSGRSAVMLRSDKELSPATWPRKTEDLMALGMCAQIGLTYDQRGQGVFIPLSGPVLNTAS